MNIALIGYGKMGRAIEEIALQRGHNISLRINDQNLADFSPDKLVDSDVAIEFTGPHSAFENVEKLISWDIPVVSGSTGWLDKLEQVQKNCRAKDGSFIYASNYSVGVNLFFELNKKLAQLMGPHEDYEIMLEEIHHTQKKDAPSGTAITLAEQVLQQVTRKKRWVNHISEDPKELEILSERIDPAPGTHKIKYSSAIDDIEIVHTAHNRKGFALGAVLAAEYISDKKGIFTMQDVLKF